MRVCVFTETHRRHMIEGKQQKIKQQQVVEALAQGTVLIPDKLDFTTVEITRDKEGHSIMTKY